MRALLVVVAAIFFVAGTADARCAVVGLSYARVGDGDVSAATPALLLGLGPPGRAGASNEEPPTALTLTARGGSHALAIETLAPGLLLVRSASPLGAGAYELDGISHPIPLQLAALAQTPAPVAPRVTSITRSLGRRRSARLEARLADPVPSGVVAVLVVHEGRAVAWRPVRAGERDEVDVASAHGCSSAPSGYQFPVVGAQVALRFADAAGQLSPPSSLVTID